MKRLFYAAGISVAVCLWVRAAIFTSTVGYFNSLSVLGVVILTYLLSRLGKNVKM